MKTAIRKMGNSHGVIIPKPLLAEVGATAKDAVDIGVENGKIVIAPIRIKPRIGWAQASKRLAAAQDSGLVWPEFGSDADAEELEGLVIDCRGLAARDRVPKLRGVKG